ncbi:hypothetical protein ACNQKP_02170 [Bdellovibrio bacteriovorus]|uniref:hypothetical protein n=1 Tax=Bdellovibrio bacteriovorus TaxID=959 RepID=UPI003AA970C0
MKVLSFVLVLLVSSAVWAALPPQFSECLQQNSGSNMTAADVTEIAKVSRITYCQNQVSLIGKAELLSMLSNPNVNIGLSVSKTSYTSQDFIDMAAAGTYVLYVDSSRLSRDNLVALLNAGVQLVVMSGSSGLSRGDLLILAAAKPFIYNVNSVVLKTDLQDYVRAGVQVVIRTAQAGLSRQDILDVAQLNSERVSIFP